MLSQTAEYALRALLRLAEDRGPDPLPADVISTELGVPKNYLSKILHALGRRGIVRSSRGPQGGFRLAVPADELSLASIVEVFDPQLLAEQNRCLLGQTVCSDDEPCLAHDHWKAVSASVQNFFRRTTLADLVERTTTDTMSDVWR